MKLNEIHAPKGATKKPKRKGRGIGSGNGKTAGKGHKGERARAGKKIRPSMEGGQMPLNRRLPKFGFVNIHRKEYNEINLFRLAQLAPSLNPELVDVDALLAVGAFRQRKDGVAVLGHGEIDKALNLVVAKCSKNARAKIEAAGGTIKELAREVKPPRPRRTRVLERLQKAADKKGKKGS